MKLHPLVALACLSVIAAGAAMTYRVATADPSVDNVPRVFPYRGSIELDGIPYSGAMDMHFYLYETASGGTSLWDEEHTVNVYNGDFAVMLGTTTDLTTAVLETEPLYVEIQIDDGTTMVTLANRQQLGTTPYAMWAANIPPNSVTATEIAAGAVGSSEVADGSLTADDLGADSVGSSEIAAGAVGSSEIATNAVDSAEIAAGAVGASEVADNSLTRTEINGEIALYRGISACGNSTTLYTSNVSCQTETCGSCTLAGNSFTLFHNCSNGCPTRNSTCDPATSLIVSTSCDIELLGYVLAP